MTDNVDERADEANRAGVDTRLKFTIEPSVGKNGFQQWYDALKAVARLPTGVPKEWRKRVWLTLADQYLHSISIDWDKTLRFAFNERSNPDDDSLGVQIVKDLHRTGCSSYCGQEGEQDRVVLKRLLLAYARWNKAVGYCQGFNVLAALILLVTQGDEGDALKVMIYLIDKVLPESYFANNLRALSVDMAVFRDLLRVKLPRLSRHLHRLQKAANREAGVVPHHVRHVLAGAHRAQDLGLGVLRGLRGALPRGPRHLGEAGREDFVLPDGRRLLQHDGSSDDGDAGPQPHRSSRPHPGGLRHGGLSVPSAGRAEGEIHVQHHAFPDLRQAGCKRLGERRRDGAVGRRRRGGVGARLFGAAGGAAGAGDPAIPKAPQRPGRHGRAEPGRGGGRSQGGAPGGHQRHDDGAHEHRHPGAHQAVRSHQETAAAAGHAALHTRRQVRHHPRPAVPTQPFRRRHQSSASGPEGPGRSRRRRGLCDQAALSVAGSRASSSQARRPARTQLGRWRHDGRRSGWRPLPRACAGGCRGECRHTGGRLGGPTQLGGPAGRTSEAALGRPARPASVGGGAGRLVEFRGRRWTFLRPPPLFSTFRRERVTVSSFHGDARAVVIPHAAFHAAAQMRSPARRLRPSLLAVPLVRRVLGSIFGAVLLAVPVRQAAQEVGGGPKPGSVRPHLQDAGRLLPPAEPQLWRRRWHHQEALTTLLPACRPARLLRRCTSTRAEKPPTRFYAGRTSNQKLHPQRKRK
ncbi:uncharacterized protein tbc1d30 isoform X5 [Hippocampus zosterae]|uniref:uncharacterized protein tbc1d30 isoform X5 n=1 Tax=Hippocampus zosterae TaxID=109293 RepID=UPI00223D998F|nr:uncharacterized protein tbc1d30 isoform X5 [Hippocampus zosterae]